MDNGATATTNPVTQGRRAAFAAFLAQARLGRRGFWRVLATLLVVVAAQILALLTIGGAAFMLGDEDLASLSDPQGQMIATLLSLATAPLALALALGLLHGRGLAGLLGASRRLELGPMAIGAAAAVALTTVGLTLGASLGLVSVAPISGYQPPWLLLAAAIALIPAQAAGEELLFRGYLLQELGSRWPHALIWAVLPSAAFAFLHIGENADALETASYVASTFLFGLLAAALVWRGAGLSAAIGLHVANNWLAICLFEPPQGVAGLGPFAIRFQPGGLAPSVALDVLLLAAALPILWRLLPEPCLAKEGAAKEGAAKEGTAKEGAGA